MKKHIYFRTAYCILISFLIAISNTALSQSITVVTPNGGEDWQVGSSQSITWTSDATSGTVRIEYSSNNGSTWSDVIASTIDNGSYSWTIPNDPSTNCLIRISDTDGDPTDNSDAAFTISAIPATISVTSPNGGEDWEVGSSHNITWTNTGTVGNVHIEYSTNNGVAWSDVVTNTDNDGTHPWTIPDEPSTNCLIRISETDGDPTDDSDATFTISAIPATITVTAPNGGEDWEVGTTQSITWTNTGTVGNVHIEYSVDNGSSWSDVIASTDNDGTHPWTIPDDPSTSCLVRVSETDGDPTDNSNAVFTISAVPATITVTSPNGGEDWEVGSSQNITWTNTGTVGNVHIEYSVDNGSSWSDVVASTGNDGSHSWTIPNEPSTTCLVRISETDGDPTDDSDAVFTISAVPATITVTSPNGGEDWQVGSSNNITWISTGTVGNVHIEYSSDNGSSWTDVVASTANDGTHPWTIPDDPSVNCLVRVSETDGDPTDDSDAVFTISAAPSTITVTSPNGGEDWLVGSSHNITWTTSGTSGNMHIEYSVNNGSDWSDVIASTPDDGIHSWTIPDEPSTSCLVRISEIDGDPADVSDAVFTISSIPEIMVTSPNGGEDWQVGSTQSITWTSSGTSGSVRIEYSVNNGTNWTDVIASTADDGSFSWTIPDDPSTTCLVRVSDTDGDPTDVCDAVFTISLEPYISVTTPNGGEDWLVGETEDITWTSDGTSGNVRIQYSINGGTNWTTITSNTPDDGLYEWTVPDNPSEDCLIRISDFDTDPVDESDDVFTISPEPFITIDAPNGGEEWAVGSDQTIAWTSSGTSGNVRIEYSANNGTSWTDVVTSTEDDGDFTWTIPDDISAICLVRIRDTDDDPMDVSDAVFSISEAPYISVTSPNGGENFMVGTTQGIAWTSYGTSGTVRIDYSTNNGTTWTNIITSTPDDGQYTTWTIPDDPSENCLVRVRDTDGDPEDESDDVFTIIPEPFVTILTPNGGEDWPVESIQEITWESSGTSGTVYLYYSTDNGDNFTVIVSNTPDDGSYMWTVPNEPSTTCFVSISDSDWEPNDRGDDVFTISDIPSISVTSPNGGENWQVGSSQFITWSSFGTGGNVSIEYSVNNGTDWITISASTPDDGSLAWIVQDNISEECLVRIRDTDGDPEDVSNAVFTISPIPFFRILTPNGGEDWPVGSVQEITWESAGIAGNVSLWYSTDSSATSSTIVESTPNDGSYMWTIPNEPSTVCFVSISDIDYYPNDEGDAVFTISDIPRITVTSPNGGEEFDPGTTQNITWTSFGTSGNVRIEYSTNNGTDWTEIIGSTPDNGSYAWVIPEDPSENCLIQISELGGDLTDVSDNVFTIYPLPFITQLTPNGGEDWSAGSYRQITWISHGTSGHVHIWYSTDNGANFSDVIASTPDDGLYVWKVPDEQSTVCLVSITDVDYFPFDEADAVFTISAPNSINSITLDQITIYPNPATDIVHIEFDDELASNKALVRITDIRGQVVLQRDYPYVNEAISIDIEEFSKGMYIIEIVTSGKSKSFMIVKE